MPELTLPSPVAPSPSPAPAAASSGPANAAPGEGMTTGGAANGQADTPFAAVLQKQIADQPAQDAAARDVQALLASLQADSAIKDEEVPLDAISLLAPMLAGIVPIKADKPADTEADTAAVDLAVVATDLPVAVAAPVTVAVAAATTAEPVAHEDSAQETSVTLDLAAGKSSQNAASSAIIAAAATAADEAATAERKKSSAADTSFDALIDAAANLKQAEGAQRAAPTAAVTAKPVEVVATPVGAHGWADDVGDKLSWMVGRKETRADLVLTPPQLGRIEVSITLNGDQASANFVTASPAVREALENAVPRLREILQDAGINLGQTQVGAESSQQSARRDENGDNRPRGNGFAGGDADTSATPIANTATTQWLRRGNGLVDLFA